MVIFATSNSEWIGIWGVIFVVLTGIFWMVIGWRAMRAHERLADAHETISRMANIIGARQVEDIEATVVPARAARPAIPTEPDKY